MKDRESDRPLVNLDIRPLSLMAASSASLALGIGVTSLMLGQDLFWCILYSVLAVGSFVVGARWSHKQMRDRDVSSELRFACEFFGASMAVMPVHLLGLIILNRRFDFHDPLSLCFKSIFVGLFIGGFPAIFKFKWLSDCVAVQGNAEQAIKEAERQLSLEQYSDAEEKMREAVLAHEVLYGSSHPLTARMVLILSRIFTREQDKEKGIALIRRSLLTFEQLLGPNAPEVADCVMELVRIDPDTDPATILPLLRRVLAMREQQFGTESLEVAEVCAFLGKAHFSSKKWTPAIEAYRRVLSILEKLLPDTAVERYQATARLAAAYFRGGRPSESEKLIKTILAQRQQVDMPFDGDYFMLLADYSQLQQRQNLTEEAKQTLLKSLGVLVEHVGPGHPACNEVLTLAAEYLNPVDSPQRAVFQALLAADGVAIRKATETIPSILTTRDALGWQLTQWAVFLNRERILDTLIYAKAPLEPEETDWPPLQIAIRWSLKRALQAIMQKSVNPAFQTASGWTALHRASQAGDERMIDSLMAKGASPNVTNSAGDTPLHIAARKGHIRVVVELLHHGADPLNVNPATGRSALHEAAERGLKPVVDCIILNCSEALLQLDQKDRTAADLARLAGHAELAKVIEQSIKLDKKVRDKEEKIREKEQMNRKEVAS